MIYTTQVPHLDQGMRSCITLGKFDGLHRGHQKLIERIKEWIFWQSVLLQRS